VTLKYAKFIFHKQQFKLGTQTDITGDIILQP